MELEGEAEGTKILAVGTATAQAYEQQQQALGQANLFGIEVAKAIATAGLKITPDIVVSGGNGDGGNANIFGAFLAQMLAANRTGSGSGNGANSQQ